eukprot:TRINITY_DN1911_c0_g1_i7.p1 TRINITY_DN1911_c0_g1~~TRINITY_DN1911_c0_g1_i7.p1  ORF type:complete len:377 (-),score=76.19 TRINITY_DN1911_c0_g1_i7:517-1647(-)
MKSEIESLKNSKFLMIIPGYGPNNQYIGMMDCMFIAKKLGRVFTRPDFFTHAINDLDSIRSFELSFEPEPMNEYIQTVSVQEYSKYCGGKINALIWLRNPKYWNHVVEIYLRHAGLTYSNPVYTNRDEDRGFYTEPDLLSFFEAYGDSKCIAITFPYATVYGSPERSSLVKYLSHSSYIKALVNSTLQEMAVRPENLLTIHWRFGEDSCGWYYSPDAQYDFCWGTTQFHYAKSSDIIEVLIDLIKGSGVTHVYVAVASHYLDPKSMKAIEEGFSKQGIKYFRAKDLPTSAKIKDNYYLSLVEQELSITSRVFCRSDSSTWSDFIVNYVGETHQEHPTIVSFAELLTKAGKTYSTWNREWDKEVLEKSKRPDGWMNQ